MQPWAGRRIWIAINPMQYWAPGTRLCADDVYRGLPQPIDRKGLREAPLPIWHQIDWYWLQVYWGKIEDRREGGRERQTNRQTDRRKEISSACWRNTKWMQMEQHEYEHAEESINAINVSCQSNVCAGCWKGAKEINTEEQGEEKLQWKKLGLGNIKGIIRVKLCLVPDSLG